MVLKNTTLCVISTPLVKSSWASGPSPVHEIWVKMNFGRASDTAVGPGWYSKNASVCRRVVSCFPEYEVCWKIDWYITNNLQCGNIRYESCFPAVHPLYLQMSLYPVVESLIATSLGAEVHLMLVQPTKEPYIVPKAFFGTLWSCWIHFFSGYSPSIDAQHCLIGQSQKCDVDSKAFNCINALVSN